MKNKKLIANYVLFVILLILPVVEAIISLCFAPNQIPMHFDRYGNVDRYGNKFELLIVPCLNIVFGLAFVAWKRLFDKAYEWVILMGVNIGMLCFNGINLWLVLQALA